ncbi:MAG: AzlC family ABC transporter permease [Rhodobacteraceae bacterium]|nr:AzlC family ABC transporter permease [Paracoccaceae bacterium]
MSSISPQSAYWQGVCAGLPFLLMIVPFGGVFGVLATEAGLNLAEVMGFSVLVIAGASQLVALQLMTENTPIFIILASSLAVNLRMAMYSAALASHLGRAPLWQRVLVAYLNVDQTYALGALEYEAQPDRPLAEKVAFFLGTATPICPMWYLATWAGAVLGARLPPDFAPDFAVPIAFIALVAPALRTVAHVAAALTAVIMAILFAALPFNLGVIPAAALAMVVGAKVESQTKTA